ncbi:uncharacterized protein LOC129946238 [Eupeodes corollae]|uniref:uncharacterized protein LOC129946238 n=1 Tax=Eupeodes corollae TaxID=290404 RepID=UPI0024905B97|nr:uncharacterized protein LOC129946238 [Eupeodes corollae]
MKLDINWNIQFVTFGLIAGFVKCFPMDMDSIKDGIQMGALTAVGMAADLAEKANAHASFDEEISVGSFKLKKKFDAGGGLMGNDDGFSEEESKKRRRRSPCFGRRRNQQTTAAPAGGGGASGANGGGVPGGGANGGAPGAGDAGGAGAPGGNPDDLRRRRKRSPDYEIDANENIIPYQKTFAQTTQEIGERMRQMMKNVLDALAGAFENLKRSFENGMSSSSDMQ